MNRLKDSTWTRVRPAEKNHHKKAIIEENLLEYVEDVCMMDRDKIIVKEYINGASYSELAQKNNLSYKTIPAILARYVRKAYACKRKRESMDPTGK